MAVWALLSISQTVKADDYFVRGAFENGDWPAVNNGLKMTPKGDNTYVLEYVSPQDGEYRFRFTGTNFEKEMCPYATKTDLSTFSSTNPYGISTDCYEHPNTENGRYFIVKMKKGTTYVFTFKEGSSRQVWCDVNTSTTPSKFAKLYVWGNISGSDWGENDFSREFITSDGKTYQYVFGTDYTNAFSNNTADFYFRVKAESKQYAPQINDYPVGTDYTSAKESSSGAWKFTMTKGKSYTLIFDYENKKIKYTEGGSGVVTSNIQLFDGETALTGSNGRYTLDLSSATTDASITLSIDDKKYGLAEAKTITAVGITPDIAFTEGASEVLTLKTGFVYTLIVAEDGKMKVVARQRGAADGNYYLVGNFFNEDGENINYDKKYFRFINNKGDGNLYFDIPASLTVKAQVYGADGKCYGPKDNKEIGINKPASIDDVTAKGEMAAGEGNYWSFTDRGFVAGKKQVGIYRVTIKVDEETGIPTNWSVTYDKTKRMAYFLVDPDEDIDAVAQPCYTDYLPNENHDKKWSNNFYGNIYLEAGQHCFVVGNIQKQANDDEQEKPLKTTTKLYLQGNGGLDPTTNTGSGDWHYTNVFPNKAGFCYGETKSMVLEYNPSKGNGDYLSEGIGGEILKAHNQITDDPITSIQIVGKGVVDSWELDKAQDMKYNKTLDCWEYKFRTEKEESVDNKFRFIANKDWKYNWGEESLEKKDQARPYTDTNPENGHEASLKDPNQLNLTKDGKAGSETDRNGSNTFGDMYFNRPAGEWTIRFYIRTLLDETGNDYKAVYAYTITGSASNDVYLTYRTGKFIRTYSNSKPMNPDNNNVKIYEVYKYEKPDKVDNIYTQGKVYLRQLQYVPANVGVVLIGEVPAGNNNYTDGQKLAFSLLERTEESVEPGGDYRDVWTKATDYKKAGDQWNNYLVPTVTAENDLGNAKVDESGKVIYRHFGLGNYYRTNYHTSLGSADPQKDYIGFFRLTAKGTSGANKAYLSIPANAEVGNGVGAIYGYIDYNGQLLGNESDDGTFPVSLAKMALIFDDLVDGNEVTGIKELETENLNNDKYYNLQGIEVAHPVKGIYIHNGKKVIVK